MFQRLKKIFFRNYNSECIQCATGSMILLCSCFGGFSAWYKCDHEKSKTSYFTINKPLYVLACFITLINITACFFYLHAIVTNENNKLIYLVLSSELLHTSSVIILNLFNLFCCKKFLEYSNKWIDIWVQYGVSLNLDPICRAKYVGFLLCSGVVFFRVYFHVRDYYLSDQLDKVTNLITKCSSTLVSMLISTILAAFNLEIMSVRIGIEQCQRTIENKMKKQKISLLEPVAKFRRLHLAFVTNFELLMKIGSPYFLIWMSLVMMELILNIYGYIYMFNQKTYNGDLIMLGMRSVVIGITMTYMLINFERLANVSDDLLSFLFKYPITSLKAEEADQVESLINTLLVKKAVMKASDVFTIGIRLLAPISGTVITYVLVALQFREAKPT